MKPLWICNAPDCDNSLGDAARGYGAASIYCRECLDVAVPAAIKAAVGNSAVPAHYIRRAEGGDTAAISVCLQAAIGT